MKSNPGFHNVSQVKCCQTDTRGYFEWYEWAKKQVRQGKKWVWCSVCKRYKFPSELCAIAKTGEEPKHDEG